MTVVEFSLGESFLVLIAGGEITLAAVVERPREPEESETGTGTGTWCKGMYTRVG